MSSDKAGREYWEQLWTTHDLVDGAGGTQSPLRLGYVDRRFARLFAQLLGADVSGRRFLELGAAASVWLPHFAREHGMRVTGLDYSERGCEEARRILARTGIVGDVVCADLFSPPDELLGCFDVVASFGVAEHFEDTARAIRAFAAFAADGGLLITVVPNMSGANGLLERLVNRRVYDMHVRLDPCRLAQLHASAGLEVVYSSYFMSTNFAVLNLNGLPEDALATRFKAAFLRGLIVVSKGIWVIEMARSLPARKLFSPYVVCLARKPGDVRA